MARKIILGERLRELRKNRNLTQTDIAQAFNIHSVTYLHYEKSEREPPLALLAEFADFFEVSVDYLLGLEDEFGNKLSPTKEEIGEIAFTP